MSTFNRYHRSDIVINTDKLVTSTWSNNDNMLGSGQFHTSSLQSDQTDTNSQGNFFIDVYHEPTSSVSSSVQFSVSYGHRKGSGSKDFTNDTGSFGYSPSKCIYNQYRQLVFGDETQDFQFSDHTADSIYVINIERARYKQNLKPGSLNLWLSKTSGTGLATIKLTDDSVSVTGSAKMTNLGRQYNIVSGADGVMKGTTISQVASSASYGLFYPDAGVIILNAEAFAQGGTTGMTQIGQPTVSSNTNGNNHTELFNVIKAGAHFIIDSEERVSSQYYFTRVKNFELNYTTNPSFIDNTGTLNFDTMIDMPRVYITTVGLYNDNGDLLAVAKLSQPLAKDFTKEALVRVKLDY